MILSNLKSKVKSQAASKNLDLLNIQGMLIWLSLEVAIGDSQISNGFRYKSKVSYLSNH